MAQTPPLSTDQELLTEIRDLLKRQAGEVATTPKE
jgi:large-conductance mechanosensitive channel